MLDAKSSNCRAESRNPDTWGTHRLWSLWDIMKKFEAADIGDLFAYTMLYAQSAAKAGAKINAIELFQKDLERHLELAKVLTGRYQLMESFAAIDRFQIDISFFASNEEVHFGLKSILGLLKSEMEKRLFFSIEPELGKYYSFPPKNALTDPEFSFGFTAETAFPSAKMDMIEAGNCLAVGRNNGAVYHLMCVAEVGLRALAWDRRVEAKQNKKSIPLEFAQWGELIGKLETEVEKIKSWRSKHTSAEAHQFYNSVLVEIRSFNTGWRTHVMHARSHIYKTDETIALFGHVKRFIDVLSTKISENVRTPYVWKSLKKKGA